MLIIYSIKNILEASASDQRLSAILNEAKEFAQIYALAKQRQKGCDGMGELAMIKEELKDSLDNVLRYCKENDYLSVDAQFDIDSAAEALVNMGVK